MPNDDLEAKMFSIFQLVNDWLKFAEAKNLAIVALAGAACSALASYLAASQDMTLGWRSMLLSSVFLFALSCLASLLSFSPRTSQEYILALFPDWGTPSQEDNLYFYKHLGKYGAAALAQRYQETFSATPAQPTSSQQQLAAQIVANSRIVVYKLRFFSISLVGAVFAVLIFLIALLCKGIASL